MKTILAPVDFSTVTDRVCEAAATLARAVSGRVILLHSVPPPIITGEFPLTENVARIVALQEKAAARNLARLQKKLQRGFVVAETLQLHGAPVNPILEQANAFGADYIVIGSHGHTALYNLLVGSTTHGVLSKSPCPVLIVPPGLKKVVKSRRARR